MLFPIPSRLSVYITEKLTRDALELELTLSDTEHHNIPSPHKPYISPFFVSYTLSSCTSDLPHTPSRKFAKSTMVISVETLRDMVDMCRYGGKSPEGLVEGRVSIRGWDMQHQEALGGYEDEEAEIGRSE